MSSTIYKASHASRACADEDKQPPGLSACRGRNLVMRTRHATIARGCLECVRHASLPMVRMQNSNEEPQMFMHGCTPKWHRMAWCLLIHLDCGMKLVLSIASLRAVTLLGQRLDRRLLSLASASTLCFALQRWSCFSPIRHLSIDAGYSACQSPACQAACAACTITLGFTHVRAHAFRRSLTWNAATTLTGACVQTAS